MRTRQSHHLSMSLGVPGTVFNGIADWVYEEEVLSDTKALWFSPVSWGT